MHLDRYRSLVSLVAVVVVVVTSACSGGEGAAAADDEGERFLVAAGTADEGIDGVEAYRVRSRDHTEDEVPYDLRPPAGGPHNPVWANCGFYDEPIADEHVVHDLEHGAVWLAYAPDLDAADVETLHELVRANPKTIATPYEALPNGAAVVATAWARQLVLDSIDDPRLARFVERYQDGSQAPEAGVTCSESPVGAPLP